MKKVLATILALVMALALCTSAWAEETTLPQADENGVITLIGNTTIDSTAVNVTTGQTTVIDLNGHNLTINYAANAGSTQFSGAGTVLTFRDSKSTGFSNEGRWQGGILTLQGERFTNIANPAFVPSIGATLNIDGVYVTCDGTGFLPLGNAAAVSVTNSFVEAKAYCVGTNSATVENSGVVITLKSSTFVTHNEDKDNCPVMINVAGKLNIDDCYICGQRQGVIVRAGEANITNSGIAIDDSARYEGSEDYSAIDWGSGNNLPSAAIVVGNKTISKTGYKADAVVVFTDSSAYGGGTAAIYTDGNTERRSMLTIDGDYTYIDGAVKKGNNIDQTTIKVQSGEFTDADAVNFAVADAALATIKYSETATTTIISEGAIKTVAKEYAEEGNVITVKRGNVALTDVPVGVTVANDGAGTVTVNGSGAITEGNPYTVRPAEQPPRYYYNSTTTTTTDTKADGTKGSPKTFDAGVGIYAVSALLSVTGMAYVGKKKF